MIIVVVSTAFVGGTFIWMARAMLQARRYAAGGEVGGRLLGACHSNQFGMLLGFPLVVLEIAGPTSTLVTFWGPRRRWTIPTSELEIEWHGSRADIIRHRPSDTRFWPRWTPVDPVTFLVPGQSPPVLR